MLALSIRQPWAELILRGIKTVEYRNRPTRIIGERFWIYAAKGKAAQRSREPGMKRVWSRDLGVPRAALPPWMLELAERLILDAQGDALPKGVIVGSACISHCTPAPEGLGYQWHLAEVERIQTLRKPERHPQPGWFRPF